MSATAGPATVESIDPAKIMRRGEALREVMVLNKTAADDAQTASGRQ